MPPEQMTDFRTVQPSADQYATAATLYYLLTGRMIYEPAGSIAELMVLVLNEEPLPLRCPPVGPTLPAGLAAVLCRALARDPGKRFANALAFRDALRAAL
jgi:serine/threonine-protein kinase